MVCHATQNQARMSQNGEKISVNQQNAPPLSVKDILQATLAEVTPCGK
jgi:hypothetical protein